MIDFVSSNETGRFSYCTYCIETHDFHLKDGVYLCEKCNRPLKTAHECAKKVNISLSTESNMVQM